VDESLASIKLELAKLNSLFDRDTKQSATFEPGVLQIKSATEHSHIGSRADHSNGHRVDTSHRDCGFGSVYTQIHDLIKGTMFHPPPPPNVPLHVDFSFGHDHSCFQNKTRHSHRIATGKLPKLNFPTFDGDSPKLWKS
jgi:hypothetical protein